MNYLFLLIVVIESTFEGLEETLPWNLCVVCIISIMH